MRALRSAAVGAASLSALVLTGAVGFAAPAASAQGIPIQVRMSTGTYLYDAEQSLVEVSLSFGAPTLTYRQSDTGGFAADLSLDITLRPVASNAPAGATDAPVFQERYERRFIVADTAALLDGQVFVEQMRAAVAPGEYQVVATVHGGPTDDWAEFSVVSDVTVPAYDPSAGTAFSSVALASSITRPTGDAADPFVKSGVRVVPNPEAFYGGSHPTLPYYVEIYNPPAGETYTLLTYIAASGSIAPIPGTEERLERARRPVDVVIGSRNVAQLPSGVYMLRLAVLNAANEAIAEQAARFYMINPTVAAPDANVSELTYEETLFAVMGEEELQLNLGHASVIATSSERTRIGTLETDDQRRDFLVRFWSSRDTNPLPSVNDARQTFYERLSLVDARYRERGQPGFRTDRGRVYLLYGSPSDIERNTAERVSSPYEVWVYDNIAGEGRSVFVFADRYDAGLMELIHSDVTGELSSPDWQRQLGL